MSGRVFRVIRRFCLACQGQDAPAVADCRDVDCLFFSSRLQAAAAPAGDPARGWPADAEQNPLRPLRLVRRYCLACSGSRQEVRACDARDSCVLWSYRFGVMPATFKRVVARRKRQRVLLTLPGLAFS